MPGRATFALLVLLAEPAEPPWPVTVVSGEVSVERGAKLPGTITGTIVDAATKDAPEHAVNCSLEGRAWRCSGSSTPPDGGYAPTRTVTGSLR